MKVEKIDGVTIMVKDLEKAGKFFADLLGTEFTGGRENKALDIRNLISPIGIELIAPLTPDGPTARALERRGEGLSLFSLRVSDLEEAIADMESHGVRLVAKQDLASGKSAVFHPKDLYGVMVALNER